ncbi:hypothetical protein GCM10028801_27510 [Nocardioides maradonensis]
MTSLMSSSASTIVFAVFAVLVVGALMVGAFVYDRRRSQEVRHDVPERIAEGLEHPEERARSTEVLHEHTSEQDSARGFRDGPA